jgi:hypothetical protein
MYMNFIYLDPHFFTYSFQWFTNRFVLIVFTLQKSCHPPSGHRIIIQLFLNPYKYYDPI